MNQMLTEWLGMIDACLRHMRDRDHPSRRWKIIEWDCASEPELSDNVPYLEFRKIVSGGNLALLYEVNYGHRRQSRRVPQVTEGWVQSVWSRRDAVPRDVFDYARACQGEIIALRQMPKVQWSLPIDRRMLRLLRHSSDLLEVAYQMRQEFAIRMTRGAIKGRFYNTLRHSETTTLRQYGLSDAEITFLSGDHS